MRLIGAVCVASGMGSLLGDTAWHRALIYLGALGVYAIGRIHGEEESMRSF